MIKTIRQPSACRRALTCFALLFGIGFFDPAFGMLSEKTDSPVVTVLCYMNGDNDLSEEVLHTLDMIETAGSSERVNVIALVDGNGEWLGQYDNSWVRTRMVKVEHDTQIGVINSPVLEDWGEANLADPRILERFIHVAIDRYPADRYFFYAFAHSQGVIDTRAFSIQKQVKKISISNDDTSEHKMDLNQFHDAIKRGLDDRRFDLIVLFSCLTNMVEIGYALADVCHYFVASQDEIRLINEPPGRFQIRGLPFEAAITALIDNPSIGTVDLGRIVVDFHVDNYLQEAALDFYASKPVNYRLPAGMALVGCQALPILVQDLNELARSMIAHAGEPMVVNAMRDALNKTPRFASFLNLEYYDLYFFVQYLRDSLQQLETIQACNAVLDRLDEQVLIYERHTRDNHAKGVSIYLSNPLVPENIYRVHQRMYANTRFSQETLWDEMIACFRHRLK